MPYDRPGSLSDDEVYAVTAYMLYLNELVDSDTRLDAASLPRISMPAQPFFRPDGRSAGIRP
jgi:cytochrome c